MTDRNVFMNGRPAAELRSYDPPWYQQLPYVVADFLYGGSQTAPQQQIVNRLFGTQNPFNLPGQVAEGMDRSRAGYQAGDYGEMASGLAQFGGAVAGPALGAFAKLGPSVRGINREQAVATRRENAGRDRATMSEDGNRTVDNLTYQINQRGGGRHTPDQIKDAIDQLDPVTRMMVNYGGLGNGRPMWQKPGHLALQAGGVAANDWYWDAGMMPWSWNAPGTLQNVIREGLPANPEAREQEMARRAQGLPEMRYPPGYPRVERTEQQMREMYDARPEGVRRQRYGIFGGGEMPYDEWLAMREQSGGTLHYPPSMSATGSLDYPAAAERMGYGPPPYKAAPNPLMEGYPYP